MLCIKYLSANEKWHYIMMSILKQYFAFAVFTIKIYDIIQLDVT